MRASAAVLWDMDGTLIDSDRLWLAAERDLYRAEAAGRAEADGGRPPAELPAELPAEAERALEGASLPECARVLRAVGVPLPAGVIADRLVSAVERALAGDDALAIPWAAGAVPLLESLAAAGVPSVLVTGTPMRIVRHVLAAAPAGAFLSAVDGDSPLPAKPAPDRYLAAACLAGAGIRDCLVFEDSGTGIRAGLAAGARVVAVTALARTPAPPSPRYRRIPDFRGLTAAALARFMR